MNQKYAVLDQTEANIKHLFIPMLINRVLNPCFQQMIASWQIFVFMKKKYFTVITADLCSSLSTDMKRKKKTARVNYCNQADF